MDDNGHGYSQGRLPSLVVAVVHVFELHRRSVQVELYRVEKMGHLVRQRFHPQVG